MIPKECKRLAEVDFPIAVVSAHSAREKSIRHGHPSTLHLWWARRPLASCRAMLMALLLPDPCDPACPKDFKDHAPAILGAVRRPPKTDEELQQALLWFIGSFANWDMASNGTYLRVARDLVKAAHPEETPLVVDPFAGGGSIPLEALRLGCETFASDLNPVACLIEKVLLDSIPRHGSKLAGELRRVGADLGDMARSRLGDVYPRDPDGARPIAYLWARTVKCESPNCGAEIPLLRSFWLSTKAGRKRAIRYTVECPKGEVPRIQFEVFSPRTDKEVPKGTISRVKATCPCCNIVLSPERVRSQLVEQRGGAEVLFDDNGKRVGGARLTAVVTLRDDAQGRIYREAVPSDYAAVRKARNRIRTIIDDWESSSKDEPCPVPDEPVPLMSGTFNVPIYGMSRWGDLFTDRQKLALVELSRAVSDSASVKQDLSELLAILVDRCADYNSSTCGWVPRGEYIGHTFTRQALPMVWDFCEIAPFEEDATGGYNGALDWVARVVENWPQSEIGQVQSADATQYPLPNEAVSVWFTDPPYYFAVPYADLSDFFFVWIKRSLPEHPIVQNNIDAGSSLTPKNSELCEMSHWDSDRYANKNRKFFEDGMAKAFEEGRRVLREDGIGSVVFAHKTTEGWEALLSGLTRGGWTITGSWPIATEMGARLRARDSAALATSVHLVCRPRPEDAPVGDWGDVLRELPVRVGDWMERLQGEGVRGADLVFACIGPALEIFSRYRRVETAAGEEVKLAAYLEKVWEVVGRAALEQVLGTADLPAGRQGEARNGVAGAVEEDARLTALFLWTLQSTRAEDANHGVTEDTEEEEEESEDEEGAPKGKAKGFSLVFDVVRRFAQPLGIQLPKWEDRIIKTEKGVVRLLPVSERAKQLFGVDGASAVAARLEKDSARNVQQMLFPEGEDAPAPKVRGRRRKVELDPSAVESGRMQEATTLDRVHAAMLLQAGGQTNALRALIKAEIDRGPYFLRLANSLSALYPPGSEEKRLLDAMLLAVPR